ncbi:MAG: alpha/beta hydrolase [Peptostreptococcaceae bacterium]
MNKRKWGKVQTEGDELFYKVTGEGEPLLLIAGGGGDGDLWLPLADELSNVFKVITYDRRANARSTMNYPNKFDISQQSRDAIAVLNAVNEPSAHILGNSSGAVIALDIATYYPQVVKSAIIHEPPIAMLHFQSAKWLRFFRSCYNCSFKIGGPSMAATKFLFGIEVPTIEMLKAQFKARRYLENEPLCFDEKRISSRMSAEYLIRQELLPITNYNTDIETILNNNCKIVITCGDYAITRSTWLGDVSRELSNLLSSELFVLPGHHGSFMDNPKDWARDIRYILSNNKETFTN